MARCCGSARPKPPRLRDPGDHARPGADCAGLSARPQARRDRGDDPRGRSCAVRPAPARLRVRHAAEPLGPVAVARQRAVLLLGQRQAADIPGTRNYMGAKEPAIDATDRGACWRRASGRPSSRAVRALDRALMSGFYAIPVFNVPEQWIARWNRIERPSATALTGYLPETWWHRTDQPEPIGDPRTTQGRAEVNAVRSMQSKSVTHPNASPTLDVLFQRILARQPDAVALVDPQQARASPASRRSGSTLRAGRPRHLGAGGALHRIRPSGQFRDRPATAEHRSSSR